MHELAPSSTFTVSASHCRLPRPNASNDVHLSEAHQLELLRFCFGHDSPPIRSFAVVRDPLEVRISAWQWLLRHGYTRSFDDYIWREDYRSSRWSGDDGVFGRLQSSFIGPCTTLFSYRNLSLVWSMLRHHYGPRLRPRRLNQGAFGVNAERTASSAFVSPAIRARMRRLFATDLSLIHI